MKTAIRKCFDGLLDLLFPRDLYCICCGKIIDSSRTYRLCNDCMNAVKWVSDRTCTVCGKRLGENNPSNTCYSCKEHVHYFRKGFTCTEYGAHERAIIFALKYDGRTDIADTIGEIMYDRMTSEYDEEAVALNYDAALPVPVFAHKQAIRGFNQAGLIAETFTSRIGMKCDSDILVRVKETHIMRSLGPDERRENIRGAFDIRKEREADVEGKVFLLIDDIYTTGATVDEITRCLLEKGAAYVDVLTFAAGADVVKV